ncbi:hypothetical protein UNDYM_2445 [Undibacterium sp. YM2]|nr:hypothetical protein UNDYM_2445 [Undibacterium sp. YM2]
MPWATTLMYSTGKTLKMFVDKEKMWMLRVFYRDQDKPGRRDSKKQD